MTGADTASDPPPPAGPPWMVRLVPGDQGPLDRALQRALADRKGRVATTGADAADAVLGVGDAAPAVQAAVARPGVRSIVLVDADVAPSTLDDIAELDDTAILTVIDPARRDRIVAAVDGHLASAHPDSELIVDSLTPDQQADAIASWLERRANARAGIDEVSIRTPDGWTLGADLHRPAGPPPPAGWPAVVLMHSGRSDRTVFDRLARLLARAGVVALALDWRGRGTSTNLVHFVDFTSEQQASVRV
ncbi:MAG: hypothetical protein HZB15_01815, partial [Actinobacteria bacterium]|nr:hypothetical protein [Actinomycetota bacterium]